MTTAARARVRGALGQFGIPLTQNLGAAASTLKGIANGNVGNYTGRQRASARRLAGRLSGST